MSQTVEDNAGISNLELDDKTLLVEETSSGEGRGQMSLDRHPKATRPAKNPKLAKNDEDFEPCTFFLYGTLMDPAVLMVVAFLQEQPDGRRS